MPNIAEHVIGPSRSPLVRPLFRVPRNALDGRYKLLGNPMVPLCPRPLQAFSLALPKEFPSGCESEESHERPNISGSWPATTRVSLGSVKHPVAANCKNAGNMKCASHRNAMWFRRNARCFVVFEHIDPELPRNFRRNVANIQSASILRQANAPKRCFYQTCVKTKTNARHGNAALKRQAATQPIRRQRISRGISTMAIASK